MRASHHAELADDALMVGLVVEDPDAATEFVRRFEAKVFGLARALTRDRSLADDVAQESFLRAWRAAATYDTRRGPVAAWLLTITRHASIDAVRARRLVPADDEQLDMLLLHATLGGDDTGESPRAVSRPAAPSSGCARCHPIRRGPSPSPCSGDAEGVELLDQTWKVGPSGQRAQGGGLIGSPATIRAKLHRFAESNVDQVILLNQAGRNRHEHICESLQLFADEIMPEFHAMEPDHAEWKRRVLLGELELARSTPTRTT